MAETVTFESALSYAGRLGAVEAWCEPRDGWAPFVLLRLEIPDALLGRTRGGWICLDLAKEGRRK